MGTVKILSACKVNFEANEGNIFSASQSSGLIHPTNDNHCPSASFKLPFKHISAHSYIVPQLLRQPVCEAGRNCVYSPYYIRLLEKSYKIMYHVKSYTFACKKCIKDV